MNTVRMPGFTAAATVYAASRNYRAMAATPTVLEVSALTPATAKDGKLEWIDCNDFPANNCCRECGNTGPGSVICCPDDYCVVIDKTPRLGGAYRGVNVIGGRMRSAG